MPTHPSKKLEVFPNPYPHRDYEIRFECPEFTCLCPRTGQPDFATIRIVYVPAKLCVELKSLKLYLWSYRNKGAFHEAVTNKILDDLVKAARPRRMEIEGDFFVRGGIHTVVKVKYEASYRHFEPLARHFERSIARDRLREKSQKRDLSVVRQAHHPERSRGTSPRDDVADSQ